MSTLLTASTLGLDLDPVSSSAVPPLAISANGSFAVESYTPSEGSAGSLLTVNLTCFNTMLPTNQAHDLRLIINDKKLCSRVKHDSNDKVTLHALLSASFASLSGSVPMSLHLHRGGTLFDYCNFGHFNFVPTPMATTSLSASAHTPSKRNRNDDESRSPPEPKKSKFLAADPVSIGDSQQAKLIIESDIAKIGDLSTWTQTEMRDRRRFVRLMRKQQGSSIRLRMIAVSTQEVERDDRNVINCMLPPHCGDEPSVSSVDIIKALEVLVNPPDRRLSIEEKNRVRRNIDTLRPTTLKKGDEGLNWIMRLRSPRPVTIAKDVKVFKWTSLEAALVKVMKKYSYQNDGSLVEQRGSPTFGETGRHRSDEASTKSEPQTPSVVACNPANPETNPVVATVLGPLSAACNSPVSSASASALSSTNECFDVQQSQGVDALLSLNPDLLLQNLLEPPASLCSASAASVSSASTLSSDSGLGLELMTPVVGTLEEFFDVENGCDISSNGSEFLNHADLEALFPMPVLDARLENVGAFKTPKPELFAAAEFESYLGKIFNTDGTFGCGAPKSSDLDFSNDFNSHLFSTYL